MFPSPWIELMIETSGARWGTVVVFRGRRVIERFKNDVVSTRSDIVEERGGGVIMEKLAECPRRLGDARRKTHAGEGGREEGRREAVVECELSTTRAFDTTFSRPLRHPAFPTFPEHFFFYSIRKLIRSLGKNLTSPRLSPRLLASKGIEEDAVGTTYAKVKREGVV